jgi:hypothetical protein
MAKARIENVRVARGISFLVFSVAFAVMLGWFFDIAVLKSVVPQWVTMKLSTAICLFFSAAILFGAASFVTGGKSLAQVIIALAMLVISLYMGVMVFSAAFGMDVGIERLFVSENADALLTNIPGRPSLATIFQFILLVLIGLCVLFDLEKAGLYVKMLGIAIICIAGIACIGYALGKPFLYYTVPGISTAMAFHTAILFVLLGFGFLTLSAAMTKKAGKYVDR